MNKPLLATRLDFFYERQNELEEAISQLEARLEELPVRSLTRDTSRIGFHSSYREIGSFADETPKWTLKYQNNLGTPLIESALIPAVVNRNGVLEAYGFPKHFRIIGVIGDESRLLFEWKNEFNLGIYPLSFPIRGPNGGAFRWEQLILEVYEGTIEGNSEFFALGEWMGFGTQIADHVNNCAFWFKISTDSGSFNHHPFWKISNLKDGHTSFGLPLGPSIEESLDPFITFEQGPPEQLELHYDVHIKRKLGRIKIYPTVQKRRETILSIGFPTGFTIDVSNKPASFGFQPDTIIKTIEFDQKRPPGQHPFVHNINVKKAQSLRIRFNTLNEVDDVPVLAMSEIEILASGVPAGRLVNSVGFSEEQRRHLPQLSDNLVQQRRLLSEHEWILGLQENGAIHREIQQKRGELNRIITARDSFTQKLSLGVLSTVIVGLVSWLAMSKLMKQRSEYKLREELAGDLHDDVGALLGCSMLAASSLENSEISERQKYQVQRIMDSTRQATQAFRDIIWINNRDRGPSAIFCKRPTTI
ncbi:MAG: hypothetical protein AAF212_10715 [Verrucomicrobiota bacterium]